MNRINQLIIITGIISSLALSAEKLKSFVDKEKSNITWIATKVTGEHNGEITMNKSYVELENNKVTGGMFVIDMNSITNSDVESAEWNGKLVGHLKSNDFFDVENFPIAIFTITKAEAKKPSDEDKSNYKLYGDVMIKGISHPIEFLAKVHFHNNAAHATGNITLDRTLWDIQYRSGKFFESLGDKLIYDNFDIKFDITSTITK